jgi:hypothetical protein
MGILGSSSIDDRLSAKRSRHQAVPHVEVMVGSALAHRATRFAGVVSDFRDGGVEIRAADGSSRLFRLIDGGFVVDGRVVSIRAAAVRTQPTQQQTASGSLSLTDPGRAKVAKASRIWVEGVHDAMLVERVWGDDLRAEGIVVERLDGIDDLHERLGAFFRDAPDDACVGVLVDHLVHGSKEQRIAHAVEQQFGDRVMVVGTPFVDVWQAIRPERLGLTAWPVIPPGQPWKQGICAALDEPDPMVLWRRILSSVRSYRDLEPSLVGGVESLIDFVCEPAG